MFFDVPEDRILQLAVARGLVSPQRVEELRRGLGGDQAGGGSGDWRLVPLLLQSGELSLDQVEDLVREASGSLAPQAGPDRVPGRESAGPDGGERYQVEVFLGAGGMGEVYKAWDTKLQRHVALKRLKVEGPEPHPRFLREAQLQARIDHANICKIYDIGRYGGRWHIAMQYIEGRTLKQLFAELGLEEKVKLVQEAAEALHAAHRLGLVHRDVKPANIMVETGEDGRRIPYVTDFGLVRDLSREGFTMTEELLGSPHYMSPEQALGDASKVDRRADVYSLGVTLYEVLSGELPFQGDTPAGVVVQVLQKEPKPLRQKNPALPLDLETIVMKCLEKEAGRRYGSARELAEELGRYLNGEPIRARRYTFLQRWAKRVRKHKALAGVLAGAGVLLLVMAGLWLQARWESRMQAEAASRFGRDVEEMESVMRYAYLVKPHDIRRDRDRLKTKIEEIKKRIKDLGRVADGPGNYALGQGYLALRDYPKARKYLDLAWGKGFQTPEAAYALGVTLGELYREELAKADRIPDRGLREEVKKRLEKEYTLPALRMLAAAQNTRGIPAEYIRALIAFYEREYDRALQALAAIKDADERFYEVNVLKGDIQQALADESWRAGKADAAFKEYEAAAQAYQAAADTGRSDPRNMVCLGNLNLRMASCEINSTNRNVMMLMDRAISYSDQAIFLNTESFDAYVLKVNVYILQAMAIARKGQSPDVFLENAYIEMKKANAIKPKDDFGYYLAGKILHIRALYDNDHGADPGPSLHEAISNFQSSLRINPNNFASLVESILALLVLADYQYVHGLDPGEPILSAKENAIALVNKYPSLIFAKIILGNVLWNKFIFAWNRGIEDWTDIDKAIGYFRDAVAFQPNQVDDYSTLAFTLIQKAQAEMEVGKKPLETIAEARKAARTALGLNPEDTYSLIYMGHAHAEFAWHLARHGLDPESELRRAEGFLKKAQVANRFNYELYRPLFLIEFIRGQRALWLGQSPEKFAEMARRIFKQGDAVRPGFFEFFNRLAEVLLIQAEYQVNRGLSPAKTLSEAHDLLQKGIKIKGDDYSCHRLLGKLEILKANFEIVKNRNPEAAFAEAEKEIDISLQLNPRSAGTYLAQAEWFFRKSRWESFRKMSSGGLLEKGSTAVNQAIALNPDYAEAYLCKGVLLETLARNNPDAKTKKEMMLLARQMKMKAFEINVFLKTDKNFD